MRVLPFRSLTARQMDLHLIPLENSSPLNPVKRRVSESGEFKTSKISPRRHRLPHTLSKAWVCQSTGGSPGRLMDPSSQRLEAVSAESIWCHSLVGPHGISWPVFLVTIAASISLESTQGSTRLMGLNSTATAL